MVQNNALCQNGDKSSPNREYFNIVGGISQFNFAQRPLKRIPHSAQ